MKIKSDVGCLVILTYDHSPEQWVTRSNQEVNLQWDWRLLVLALLLLDKLCTLWIFFFCTERDRLLLQLSVLEEHGLTLHYITCTLQLKNIVTPKPHRVLLPSVSLSLHITHLLMTTSSRSHHVYCASLMCIVTARPLAQQGKMKDFFFLHL